MCVRTHLNGYGRIKCLGIYGSLMCVRVVSSLNSRLTTKSFWVGPCLKHFAFEHQAPENGERMENGGNYNENKWGQTRNVYWKRKQQRMLKCDAFVKTYGIENETSPCLVLPSNWMALSTWCSVWTNECRPTAVFNAFNSSSMCRKIQMKRHIFSQNMFSCYNHGHFVNVSCVYTSLFVSTFRFMSCDNTKSTQITKSLWHK